jgi:alpha-L-arabinofuranosidase
MEDALVFGGACLSLLNHADRVRCACLAQLVNVIAPIMTETGGPAWRQTIFYPFAQMSRHGRGRVLRARVDSPTYATRYYDPRGPQDHYIPVPEAPYLKASVVANDDGGLTLFALNRHLSEPLALDLEARGFEGLRLESAETMHDDDLAATNTKEAPERIKPRALDGARVEGGRLTVELPAASWTVLRLAGAAGRAPARAQPARAGRGGAADGAADLG